MEAMDNGTLVESFKFLNYCELAKNSLASKRFRDVIRMHRHKLALLNVESIELESCNFLEPGIRIFGKALPPEEYNEWIVRNEYSKQIPLECQVAEMENTEDERKLYELRVNPNLEQRMNVFHARAELNHENWPLFEHFIRLLTDPFIYVQSMELTTRNEILHLLEKAMNLDRSRLQCDRLWLYLEGNAPKFISWIKNHVRCDRLHVVGCRDSNKLHLDKELLDLFMTGANCSSRVLVSWNDSFPKIVDDFVQKFMDLKARDEYLVVKSIGIDVDNGSIDELKKKYAGFIVKEELNPGTLAHYFDTTKYTFEFVNDNIGKRLQLTTHIVYPGYHLSCVSNL